MDARITTSTSKNINGKLQLLTFKGQKKWLLLKFVLFSLSIVLMLMLVLIAVRQYTAGISQLHNCLRLAFFGNYLCIVVKLLGFPI